MARIIIDNKILNQMALIRSHRWNKEYDWHKDIQLMESLRLQIPNKESSNELFGIEGMCSNIYLNAFVHMLKGDFAFSGRNRRPPKDPINIILSLAYTFLTKEVISALDAESFETYLGFLHGVRYGRKSLGLDIVEEFRQPVVDRLVMNLFNKRMLGTYDFDTDDTGRVLLNDDGFSKFCKEYERWINRKISSSEDASFRKVIRSQVSKLKTCIMSQEVYSPYRWRD